MKKLTILLIIMLLLASSCADNGDNSSYPDETGNDSLIDGEELNENTLPIEERTCAELFKGGDVILPEDLVDMVLGWDSAYHTVSTPIVSITFPDNCIIMPREIIAHTVLDYYVSDTNSNYVSIDGVIYTKDQTRIVAYPCGRKGSFTIPDSVIDIGANAFAFSNLESVYVPDSVETIGPHAFGDSKSLRNISLPANINVMEYFLPSDWIETGEPSGVRKIVTNIIVTYRGTYEEWKTLDMPIYIPDEQLVCDDFTGSAS